MVRRPGLAARLEPLGALFVDSDGWTPLHHACFRGDTACVEAILKGGLPTSAVNQEACDGYTPFMCALAGGAPEAAALLAQHGGAPPAPSQQARMHGGAAGGSGGGHGRGGLFDQLATLEMWKPGSDIWVTQETHSHKEGYEAAHTVSINDMLKQDLKRFLATGSLTKGEMLMLCAYGNSCGNFVIVPKEVNRKVEYEKDGEVCTYFADNHTALDRWINDAKARVLETGQSKTINWDAFERAKDVFREIARWDVSQAFKEQMRE